MKKNIVILLIILIGWLAVRFIIGGNEDDWICQGGQWVKHGQPSSPVPSGNCHR